MLEHHLKVLFGGILLLDATNAQIINAFPVVPLFLGPNLPDIPYFGSMLGSIAGISTAYQVQCTSSPATFRSTQTITRTRSLGSTQSVTSTSVPGITNTITRTRSLTPTNTITITTTNTGPSNLVPTIVTSLVPELVTSIVPEVLTSLVPNVISEAAGPVTSLVPNVVTDMIPSVLTSLVPEAISTLVPAATGLLGGILPAIGLKKVVGNDEMLLSKRQIGVSIPGLASLGIGATGIGVCLLGSCQSTTLSSSITQNSPPSLTSNILPPTTSPAGSSCPFTTGPPPLITQTNFNTFIGTLPNKTFTCEITTLSSISACASCLEIGTLPCGSVYTTAYTLSAMTNLLKPVTVTSGYPTPSLSSIASYGVAPGIGYGAAPISPATSAPVAPPQLTNPTLAPAPPSPITLTNILGCSTSTTLGFYSAGETPSTTFATCNPASEQPSTIVSISDQSMLTSTSTVTGATSTVSAGPQINPFGVPAANSGALVGSGKLYLWIAIWLWGLVIAWSCTFAFVMV